MEGDTLQYDGDLEAWESWRVPPLSFASATPPFPPPPPPPASEAPAEQYSPPRSTVPLASDAPTLAYGTDYADCGEPTLAYEEHPFDEVAPSRHQQGVDGLSPAVIASGDVFATENASNADMTATLAYKDEDFLHSGDPLLHRDTSVGATLAYDDMPPPPPPVATQNYRDMAPPRPPVHTMHCADMLPPQLLPTAPPSSGRSQQVTDTINYGDTQGPPLQTRVLPDENVQQSPPVTVQPQTGQALASIGVKQSLHVKAVVRLVGLVAMADLNGAEGVCTEFDEPRDRWIVRLNGGEERALKPANLELVKSCSPAANSRSMDGAGGNAVRKHAPVAPLAEVPQRGLAVSRAAANGANRHVETPVATGRKRLRGKQSVPGQAARPTCIPVAGVAAVHPEAGNGARHGVRSEAAALLGSREDIGRKVRVKGDGWGGGGTGHYDATVTEMDDLTYSIVFLDVAKNRFEQTVVLREHCLPVRESNDRKGEKRRRS
eukprot:TRINITY_DN7157_c0_g1_i1.p1 TRINITY_DN7157_c0_g1~~TRINITY_DN7157_c0_g1_i1.p1  ORF type:complete len:511 (-),score=78.60 TRINITY_DN7157_c0_g1_i1:212-1681(-)